MRACVCVCLEVHVLKVRAANFTGRTFRIENKGNTGCTSGTAIVMKELREHEVSTEHTHKTEGQTLFSSRSKLKIHFGNSLHAQNV